MRSARTWRMSVVSPSSSYRRSCAIFNRCTSRRRPPRITYEAGFVDVEGLRQLRKPHLVRRVIMRYRDVRLRFFCLRSCRRSATCASSSSPSSSSSFFASCRSYPPPPSHPPFRAGVAQTPSYPPLFANSVRCLLFLLRSFMPPSKLCHFILLLIFCFPFPLAGRQEKRWVIRQRLGDETWDV